MIRNPQDSYLLSYRNRKRTWALVLLAIAVVSLSASLLLWLAIFPDADTLHELLAHFHDTVPHFWLDFHLHLAIVVAFLTIIIFFAYWSYTLWYSIWFRRNAWRSSLALGQLYRWLTSGWRLGVLLFILVAVAAEWRHTNVSGDGTQKESEVSGVGKQKVPESNLLFRALDFNTLFKPEPNRFIEVLLAMALIVILVWIYRSRRRIAILPFENYTGDDALKAVIEGAASALRADLMHIVDLYMIIDEATPKKISEDLDKKEMGSGIDKSIGSIVSVQDVGETLKDAVSSDTKLSFGTNLQIPVGWIMTKLGSLLQGPMLTGSIHKEGGNLVIRAQLAGGGMRGNWCVTLQDLDETPRGHKLPEALSLTLEQLACRMFTDLVNVGSKHWRAVRYFTEGLRAYRDAKSSQERRRFKLREAEQAFMRARSIDIKFGQCHYNLGVVYRELGKPEAAETAFRFAMRDDPENYEACYALALNYYYLIQDKNALWHCDQAISLRPADGRAWNLKGLILGYAQETTWSEIVWSVVPLHEIATALTWRALCCSALRGRVDPKLRDEAHIYSSNLAIAYDKCKSDEYKCKSDELCLQNMWQAIDLVPTDSGIYFELGKKQIDNQHWAEAAQALDRAYEETLDERRRPLFWVLLAATHANLATITNANAPNEHEAIKQEALLHFCDAIAVLEKDTTAAISEEIINYSSVFEKANDLASAHEVKAVLKFRYWLDNVEESKLLDALMDGGLPIDCDSVRKQIIDWAQAQIKFRLAQIYMDDNRDHDKAYNYLAESIDFLKLDHKTQIRIQGLYGQLALAYVRAKPSVPHEAQYSAHLAVSMNPERAWERGVLGEIYISLRDFERAKSHLDMQQIIESQVNSDLERIALMYWEWGMASRNRKTRRYRFKWVTKYFRDMLKQITDDPPMNLKPADLLLHQGWGHYWLGQFHCYLLEYNDAIYHLRIAQAMGFKPLESCVTLGATYLELKAYAEAEEMYREALKQCNYREALKHFRDLRKQALPLGKTTVDFNKPLEKPGEDLPLNEILLKSLTGLARVFIERGVRMYCARRLIAHADSVVPSLIGDRRGDLFSLIRGCEGLIALKNKEWGLARTKLEKAVTYRSNKEESYFYLAKAYWHSAQADSNYRQTCLEKCREACGHAGDADLRGRFTNEIKELLSKLDKAESASTLTSAAPQQTSTP